MITHLLAAGTPGTVDCSALANQSAQGVTNFFNSTGGQMIAGVGAVFGVLIVIFGLFKVVKAAMSGKPGQAILAVALTAVAAAFLFQPAYALNLISLGQDAIKALFEAAPTTTGSNTLQCLN